MLTHLPVELDQSNSAYQHIALLMNDKKLLRQANGGELWSDLYRLIANDEVMDRDGLTNADEKRKLIKLGWKVIDVWECTLRKKNLNKTFNKLERLIAA